MKLNITSAKLTGSFDSAILCQIHEFKPNEEDKLATRGYLFLIIAASQSLAPTATSDSGLEKVLVGRQIIARFHELYFADSQTSCFEALQSTTGSIFEEYGKAWSKFEICAAAIVDNVIYLTGSGGSEVYLARDGNLVHLIKPALEIQSISGYLKNDDSVIFGTKLFFETFTIPVIKTALESSDSEHTIASFEPAVRARTDLSMLGALVLKAEETTQDLSTTGEQILPQKPQKSNLVRQKIVNVLDKIISKLPERGVVVHREYEGLQQNSKRTKIVIVGGILLAILIISVLVGVIQKGKRDKEATYQITLNEVTHNLSEAQAVAALNLTRARQLIFSSKAALQKLKDQGIKDPKLDQLFLQVKEKLGIIGGIYEVNSDLYLDLTLIASGFSGNFLTQSQDRMLVLDKINKRLVSIDVGNKTTSVVAGPNKINGNPQGITAYSDRSFVLNDDGIDEIHSEAKQVVAREWEAGARMAAYTGNLYVLDKKVSQVWKFQGVDNTFSKKQKWFADNPNINLTEAVSWALDGSVWVMTTSGDVYRFSAGNRIAFALSGYDGTIGTNPYIYTNEDNNYLYVLDPQNQRIMVFDKEGKYKAEYKSTKLKDAKAVVVSEKYKKIIFLTGQTLYSIEAKHL